MTGNQIKGKGFRGALEYNLEKVAKGVAERLDHNFSSSDKTTILNEVRMIKATRPNLQKYFYHTSINFPPNENLTNDLMKKIGREYLTLNGFTQHQYIMFRHHDADHPHLHILVNRIGFDGKVLSDSNDFQRSENVLRQLEIKYNLTQVTPSKQVQQRAMTKDEWEMMKRTNEPSQKIELQLILKDILKSDPYKAKLTTSDYIDKLETKGINVLFNQATTGYVSGISYSYKGITITGAKLGQAYKWASIKNSIDYEQERDRGRILQSNNQRRQDTARGNSQGAERRSGNVQAAEADLRANKLRTERAGEDSRLSQQNAKHTSAKQRTSHQTGKRTSKPDRNLSEFLQQSKNGFDLASALDRGIDGLISSPHHEPHLDEQNDLNYPKKKRKKKRPRL